MRFEFPSSRGGPPPLPGERWPAWKTLIAVNIACFVGQLAAATFDVPVEAWLALSRAAVVHGRVWQSVTYMFLHANWIHLGLNMFTLYFAGRIVENNLGARHLLKVYFIGGLVGGLAQLAAIWRSGGTVVGASAGVCAALFAFTTLFPEARLTALLFFVVPVRLKARHLALGFIAVSVFFIVTDSGGNIGHVAHLGGCLVGWFMTRRVLRGGVPVRIPVFRGFSGGEPGHPTGVFVGHRIDAILDKVAREGIHSLTPEERRLLENDRDLGGRRRGGGGWG